MIEVCSKSTDPDSKPFCDRIAIEAGKSADEQKIESNQLKNNLASANWWKEFYANGWKIVGGLVTFGFVLVLLLSSSKTSQKDKPRSST